MYAAPSAAATAAIASKLSATSHASTLNHAHARTLYGKGPQDVLFTITCALAFTLLRELCMQYVFGKLARGCLVAQDEERNKDRPAKVGRAAERAERKREQVVTRFAEQGWSFLYCTVFWSIGAVSSSPIVRQA